MGHILPFAANVGFIRFYRAVKGMESRKPGKPGSLLGDAKITV